MLTNKLRGKILVEAINRPIIDFFCHNPKCPDHNKKGGENLIFRGFSGEKREIRMVYCFTCKKSYSERKGTALSHVKISHEKAISILEHLREGLGMRATARLVKVDKDTVARLAKKAGEHALLMHNDLVKSSPQTREIQMDEKWAYVGKKQRHLSEEEKKKKI